MARPFTKATGAVVKKALASRLIHVADRLRDLNTRFGVRRYTVTLVRTRWTGGVRYEGQESVFSEVPILPTPKLSDLSGVREILSPIGLDEVGGISLSEVSGRFLEEELTGCEKDGSKIPDDQNFYYEIQFVRADGQESVRRRFQLAAAPNYIADEVQWVVTLERARGDRTNDGDPT